MTSPEQHLARPPEWRWRALLVLGVLAGLLAMHALAPGGGPEHTAGAQHMTTVAVSAHDDCAGGGGGCGGGHVHHADPTCAAAAVSGAPVLPALLPDPAAVPVRADAVCPYAPEAPDSARAPPSLAELQLLRI